MVLKRNTVTKLASLSAFGAGAMVLAVQEADAGTIQYSGLVNAKVGFDTGYLPSYTSPALGSGGPTFHFGTHVNAPRTVYQIQFGGNMPSLKFATSSILQIFAKSAQWAAKVSSAAAGVVASRFKSGTTASIFGSAFNNRYALIHFGPGAGLYGWIQLSLSLSAGGNVTDKTKDPNLTIIDFAFDTSGAQIKAGDTGITTIPTIPTVPDVPAPPPPSVPEPATFEMTGLAALVLGAAGLRKWRAARAA